MKTKDLVYVGIYVALVQVLDIIKEMIPFLNLPQGGSINIALIPLVVASFHLGYKKGLVVGAIWWLTGTLFGYNEWFLNPMQYLLDYIIPSLIMGLASIFYKKGKKSEIYQGILFTMLIRSLAIILSGVYYWPDGVASGSVAAWIASINYNVPYSIATLLVLMVVVPMIVNRIQIDKLKKKM